MDRVQITRDRVASTIPYLSYESHMYSPPRRTFRIFFVHKRTNEHVRIDIPDIYTPEEIWEKVDKLKIQLVGAKNLVKQNKPLSTSTAIALVPDESVSKADPLTHIIRDFAGMLRVMPEQHGEKIVLNPDEVYDLVKKHKITPESKLGEGGPLNLFFRDLIINAMLAEQQFNKAREELGKSSDNESAIGCAIMEVTLRDRKTTLKHFATAYKAMRASV